MQISQNKLEKTLITLGLSDKEAQVYLASMSLGPTTIANIAKNSGIKRTTVYSIFEELKQKGLMREELKGWKALYVAESPEKLEILVNNMRQEVKKSLPEFKAMFNLHSSGAFIKYYEGIEGIKNVYEDLLQEIKAHDDYLVIGDMQKWLEQDKEFFEDFARRRAKLNINIRILLQQSESAQEFKVKEKIFNEQIKIMPPKYKLTTNMVIVPHKVIINQIVPPLLCMVIENDNVVQMNRELFEMIWQSIT